MADRLISADALTRHIENQYRKWGEEYDALQILGDIEDAPTIEAEPVKHGRWIKLFETEDDITARCSECGMVYTLGKGRDPNYCGTCGAKMDEVEE